MIYDHIKDKIKPFVENFQTELIDDKRQMLQKLSSSGLLESGYRIKKQEEIFIKNLESLVTKIKDIIFNEVRNEKITPKPKFTEVKKTIEKIITYIINEFKKNFREDAQRLMNKNSVNQLLENFNQKVNNLCDRLFVIFEQEFDSII